MSELILHHPLQLDIHKEESQDIMEVSPGWNSHFKDTIISDNASQKGLYFVWPWKKVLMSIQNIYLIMFLQDPSKIVTFIHSHFKTNF